MSEAELLTPKQLAEWIKVPERTLSQWRYLKEGPRYLKLGSRVRYRRSVIDEWLTACEREPGGPEGKG